MMKRAVGFFLLSAMDLGGGGKTAAIEYSCVYLSPAVSQQGHSYPPPRDNMLDQLLAVLSIRADMPIIPSV